MISIYPLLFLIFCTSLIIASTLQTEKGTEKCSNIICPPVEATICVKVKERNTQRRYVMMSKCELKLMKCHGDMKTTVVTAKYCNALRQGDMLGDKEKELALESDVPLAEENSRDKSVEGPVGQEDPVKDLNPDEVPQEEDPAGQKEIGKENNAPEIPQEEDSVNGSNPPAIPKDENIGSHVKEPELTEILPEGDEKIDDNDGEKKGLDLKENEETSGSTCPQICSTRGGRLVCARCSHGVYRTFLSSCYMRMYQCKHPNEKLELVSRRACTASAPYLGEMPRPKSKTDETQSGDIVLNHIYGLSKIK